MSIEANPLNTEESPRLGKTDLPEALKNDQKYLINENLSLKK